MRLLECVESQKRVAAAGPLTCDRGHQSVRVPRRLKQSGLPRVPPLPIDLEAISGQLQKRTTSEETELAFFCTLLNGQALDELGGLDASYESGLMADNEWCRQARSAGWRLLVHHGGFADHDHSETFRRLGLDRRALHRQAIAQFRSS